MALALPPPPGPGRAMEEPPPAGPERGAGDREVLRGSLRGIEAGHGTGRHHVTAALRGQAWHAAGHGDQRQEEAAEETGEEPLSAAGPLLVLGEDPLPATHPGRPGSGGLGFGLLSVELHRRLLDQEDYRNRTRAVEELKRVVGAASQAALISTPMHSLLGLISLLYTLLDDPNFKVVLGALEATHLLALRLGPHLQPFLGPLVSAAAKVLGDNKVPIRQQYSRLLLALMRAAGPQPVLALLLQHGGLRHKNSRVREEVVNVCIAALLSHPSEELDLAKLAFALAPALVDSKRRVRHAAMEAFAALAAAAGPGRTGLLLRAVSAVELEENGDGVMHAVQARLARKSLPKLVDQGFVEYAVPLPSSGHGRGSCLPPGADTDWLLMGSRTQSAHSYCGYHARDDALQSSGCACAGPRRVLSAGKGKNKLPWDEERAAGREGAAGFTVPFAKGVDQFSTANDFLHSPKLRPSPGVPASDELFFSRRRASRLSFQNSLDLSSERSSACAGAMGSHQLQTSGKCGTLGCTQPRGKSGSVDTDLQLLGLSNCQQDKVCASLNFSSQTQRSFCSPADHTVSFQGANASQGTFILPSYPLLSPRNSPKPVSSPADSPKKSQDNPTNFSNSWPLRSFEGLPKPSAQKQLPSQRPADSAGENLQENCSLLQLKPTLVRRMGSRRGLNGSRPFPPIPCLTSPLPDKVERNLTRWRNEECEDVWLSAADTKLGADISELSVDDEEVDQEEMENSLRSLRSSAASKRAKLKKNTSEFESADPAGRADLSVESPSHSSSCSIPQRRRITSDTLPVLGSRSQPVRVSSARHGDGNAAESHFSTGLAESPSSFAQMSSLDAISPSVLSEDAVVVLGKGGCGSPPAARAYSQSATRVVNGDDGAVTEEPEPSAQQSSTSQCHVASETEMAKSAQERARRKKKEEHNRGEHQEDGDLDGREENPWGRLKLSEAEKLTADKVTVCGDVLTSSRSVPLSLESMALGMPLRKTSSLRRSRRSGLLDSDDVSFGARGHYKDQIPSVTHSPEIMDQSELRPFSKPETAVAEALALLADEDWEKKIEGLNFVRRLSAYHAGTLTANLHETSLAVAQEVKNLRSGVSRAAVVCLGDLFTHLKKSMDQELDNTVKVLLHKAGESNTFIREEVDKALKAMVNNVTPARALCSLINGGQSHLHSAVRRCTAQHLSDVVERMGPERILSGTKGVAEGIFPAIARLAQDSSQQTRYYGRKMLFCMMAHPDFDKTLERCVPSKDLPYIKESVSNLCEKGLGEMPVDTPSAKGRRSHTSGAGHSRSSSTSRDALNVTDRETAEAREVVRKAASPRAALDSEEYLKDITALLNAKDFRDRIHGVKQLLADAENNQGLVVANIVKIFDAFKSRLHDSNSKVNQVALETMHRMVPLLKDNLTPVINMLIPAVVDNNLNSKNPGIYAAATSVVQALCQHLDNSLLLQPFCTKAQFLSGKAKQDLTERLADLVTELYPRKPYAVEHKVLPVLWHLLGNMTSSGSVPGAGGNVRTATAKLSKALFAQLGPSLLAQAAAQPPHIKRSLEDLLETAT